MDLTPIDLRKQEFKRVLRGYDPSEVRRFLEEVGESWESLIRSQEDSRRRAAELGEALENYRRMERTLNDTLLAAQRIAEESRETTLKEAEIIRREAEAEGRRAVERAAADARGLEEQIRELRVQRDNHFLKLRNLMEEELLRLHALRETHGEPVAAASDAARPDVAGRRTATAPSPGARELLDRPVGLGTRPAAAEAAEAWSAEQGRESGG